MKNGKIRKNLDLSKECIQEIEIESKLTKKHPANCFKLHAESILEKYAEKLRIDRNTK